MLMIFFMMMMMLWCMRNLIERWRSNSYGQEDAGEGVFMDLTLLWPLTTFPAVPMIPMHFRKGVRKGDVLESHL